MGIAQRLSNRLSLPLSHRLTEFPVALLGGDAPLSAAFSQSSITPVAGQDVAFTNNSTGAVSYSWDFGDGTVPNTSTNPTHYFVGLGPYTVTLTATDSEGNESTATATISPTAPSASPNLTLVDFNEFSSDLTGANAAVGNFDSMLPASGSFAAYSVPVGAKLAASAGVGYSAYSSAWDWGGRWAITSPQGSYRQIGAWYRFESFSSTYTLCSAAQHSNTTLRGVAVNSSGQLCWSEVGALTVLRATAIPLNKWVWIGMAFGGIQSGSLSFVRVIYKEHDSAVEVITHSPGLLNSTTNNLCVGAYNTSGNKCPNNRISYATLHTLAAISDATVPNDIVRPQSDNHVYKVDPSGGSDSNNGITGAWKTITKVNQMLGSTYRGIISNRAAATTVEECGLGAQLVIDTSAARFDVGVAGLRLATESMLLKPAPGQNYIDFKAEAITSGTDWTVTSGYTGIYQTNITDATTRVWQDNIYHQPVANLAALDAATAGASTVVSNVLYIKPFGGTDPRSDGKTYAYGRIRPLSGGDTIGCPVVALASRDLRIVGVKTNCTAVNANGSYAIGDITGFSGKALVENFDCRRGDKHVICWTINATNSEIEVRNGVVDQGLGQVLTDYMSTGSGNVHRWINVEVIKQQLDPRSSSGVDGGCYYSHGGGANRFSLVSVEDCDWGNNSISYEGAASEFTVSNSTLGAVLPTNGKITIDGCELGHIPSLLANSSLNDCVITPVDVGLTAGRPVAGAVAITNNNFDLRDFMGSGSPSLWDAGASPLLTVTGNTFRFGSAGPKGSCPIIEDMATANIATFDNNTYYIAAGAVFAKNFNDGTTTADRTFAQWQALGYDTNSTRLDP